MAHIPWKTIVTAGGLVAAAMASLAFYQYRPLAVAVLQPERDVAIKVFGLGTVEARVLSKVGFKVAGTLVELKADHGDWVRSGQVLARIDNKEQKARLAKANAQLQSAEAAVQVATAAAQKSEAQLAQRARTNQRRQELLAKQAVSAESAEDAQLNERVAHADTLVTKSEVESARAKLDDARAQVEYEMVILDQHELRAPFDGVIVLRSKEPGSILPAGEALFTIVAPETVWMLAYIDEARAGDIRVGQPVEIKLRSLPQQFFKGRVDRVGIESDRINEERRIYVTCQDCPEAFYLGEQAEVFITTAALQRALMIPEAAIDHFDGASGTIWTIEDGRLQRRRVTFGKRSLDGRVEVTGGLAKGVVIPVALSTSFREGRSVRVTQGQGG